MKKDEELKKISKIKSFIVTEPGLVLILKKNQLLSEDELSKYQEEHGEESFSAGIGAEAIREMFDRLGHGIDVSRGSSDSLGEHAASSVENASR